MSAPLCIYYRLYDLKKSVQLIVTYPWNSPESTSVYGILFLNPTLPDDNTNGGIILPPSAVEDGAYEFETILN